VLSIREIELSQAGVGHLIKMEKLHTLDLGLTRCLNSIINVAGEVPSLRNLTFDNGENQNEFIDAFGLKYPEKLLVVTNLT
jgi:hypothetical protein